MKLFALGSPQQQNFTWDINYMCPNGETKALLWEESDNQKNTEEETK